MNSELQNIINNLPESPGCYLWKDVHDNIIYIGKAKNLKKRVLQYFNKEHNQKISKLVNEIYTLDYIVVRNENESLILENNLIKEHKPIYNVLLKEGTNSYPYIVVTDEKHPRIVYTRIYKKYKGKHYGPFASSLATSAYDVYTLLNKLFMLRKCNKLPQKECMYYHLKQCLAPCIKVIDEQTYIEIKNEIDDLFKNKPTNIMKWLKDQEDMAVKNLEFEQASLYFNYASQLKSVCQTQIVQLNQIQNADIVGFYANNNHLSINIFNFINGKLLIKHAFISRYYDDLNEVITSYLWQYYELHNKPNNIYINLDKQNTQLLTETLNTKIITPSRGQYLELITTAIANAKEYLEKNELQSDLKHNKTIGAQNELAQLLHLDYINHIEIIDNSNLFMENPVSAVVVYKNALPAKQLYRKYNLLSNQKSDYHFMKEVILRRYQKITNFPQLLILDGGKIQVQAAIEILSELGLLDKITVIGLVKNNKHQTDAIIDQNLNEIKLDHHSNLYNYLANMQNEVHRYVITFFRNKASKSKLTQFLDNIEGLGEKSKQKLLSIYPNIYELKYVDVDTITQIISRQAAIKLKEKIDKELNNDKENINR